jgi:hypothetical protein
MWEAFLKSTKTILQISFSQEDAKEKNKSLFVTPSHILTKLAANTYVDMNNMKIAVSVYDKNIPPGEYPFSLYSWEYKGIRPRIEYIPICKDVTIEKEFFNLIQEAVSIAVNTDKYIEIWKKYEEKHLSLWQIELDRYRAEVKSNSDFRIASLAQNMERRKKIASRQLAGSVDPKIVLMRKTQIERIESGFEAKKINIEEICKAADIHTALIANGVLEVKGESENA